MKENMPCGIVQDLIPLVIDDVVNEESKQAVKAHLFECAECARLYESLKQKNPMPVRDEQEAQHFRQSMRRVSRRGRKARIAAVCLALALLVCVITAIANPEMLLSIRSEVPVEWMGNAHLVRTRQNIVLLQFTPSEKYRAFFGEHHLSGKASNDLSKGVMDWKITFSYPKLARKLDLKLKQESLNRGSDAKMSYVKLPDGDWLVPINLNFPFFYDEKEDCIVMLERRVATAEEIHDLVEKGIRVSGDTRIAALDYATKAASFSIDGLGRGVTVYSRGDEIPLIDAEAQKLYDELLEICPSYDIQPGIVLTDWGYSDW